MRRRLAAAVAAALLAIVGYRLTGVVESASPDAVPGVYVAPDGLAEGDGSRERPIDLGTALSMSSPVRPGGTLWLRGGNYRVGPLTSALAGTEGAPITVRSVPGETAKLDGAAARGAILTIYGAWTIYRDFEVTSSDTWRSGSEVRRASGIDVHGAHVTLANLVVHDLATGLGIWSDAVDSEAYGNIIYYNGWMGPDRPHGHGIYTQNKTGIRRLTDNVIFGQFGIGIHAYASEQGYLDDIQLEGNVVAGNGIPSPNFNILVGGHRLARRPVLRSNFSYDNPGAGNNVGYEAGCEGAIISGNYFAVVREGYALQLVNCGGVVERNVLAGGTRVVAGGAIGPLADQFPANDFAPAMPGPTTTFVRPNRFTPGRAHVIVYNWEHRQDVRVDLTPAGIALGASFVVRDVRNLGGPPLASGVYAGMPVRIPLVGLTAAPMMGWEAPPHSAPEFAVFLVTSGSTMLSPVTRWVSRIAELWGG